MNEKLKDFGKKIKELRSNKGWSQGQLRRELETKFETESLALATIKHIELGKGKKGPSAKTVQMLADVFSIEPRELTMILQDKELDSKIKHHYKFERLLYGRDILSLMTNCHSIFYKFDYNINNGKAIESIEKLLEILNKWISNSKGNTIGFDSTEFDKDKCDLKLGKIIADLNGNDVWIFGKWYVLSWGPNEKHPLPNYFNESCANWTLCCHLYFSHEKTHNKIKNIKDEKYVLEIDESKFQWHNSEYKIGYFVNPLATSWREKLLMSTYMSALQNMARDIFVDKHGEKLKPIFNDNWLEQFGLSDGDLTKYGEEAKKIATLSDPMNTTIMNMRFQEFAALASISLGGGISESPLISGINTNAIIGFDNLYVINNSIEIYETVIEHIDNAGKELLTSINNLFTNGSGDIALRALKNKSKK